jgi:hypothetical protein
MNDSLNPDGLSCNEIRALLVLFVGEDLDAAESARVARHLSECGACRAEQARWMENRARLATLRETTTFSGKSVWRDVRAELVREGRIADGGAKAVPRVLRWAPFAAAAAALLAFGVFTWIERGDAPRMEDPIVDAPAPVEPSEDRAQPPTGDATQPVIGPQLANSRLRKAVPGEEALIFTAEPLDPFDRARRGLSNAPALNLAGDEEIR